MNRGMRAALVASLLLLLAGEARAADGRETWAPRVRLGLLTAGGEWGRPPQGSIGADLCVLCWFVPEEMPGPAVGALYLTGSYFPDQLRGLSMSLGAGATFSFERAPRRRILIPYYGLEVGALFSPTCFATATITPKAGLVVLRAPGGLSLEATGGYQFTTARIDVVTGFTWSALVGTSF